MAKVNGTHAKEVAIYFLDMTQDRYTPAIVAKTVVQAKHLLGAGYTVEEIKRVIKYIVDVNGVSMYSLGYVSSAINSVLEKINELEKEEVVQAMIQQSKDEMSAHKEADRGEVEKDESESRERNRKKLDRVGIQSREREKSYLDMLKE